MFTSRQKQLSKPTQPLVWHGNAHRVQGEQLLGFRARMIEEEGRITPPVKMNRRKLKWLWKHGVCFCFFSFSNDINNISARFLLLFFPDYAKLILIFSLLEWWMHRLATHGCTCGHLDDTESGSVQIWSRSGKRGSTNQEAGSPFSPSCLHLPQSRSRDLGALPDLGWQILGRRSLAPGTEEDTFRKSEYHV